MPSSPTASSTSNHIRPAKRRRRESNDMSTTAVEGANATPVEQPNATAKPLLESLGTLTAVFDSIRHELTCNICLRFLYEPYTLSCGHTHCYTCLLQWFDSNDTNGEPYTCPNCRAVIVQRPAPSYTIRELTHKIIKHRELLPENETCEEHEALALEEAQLVENDRAGSKSPQRDGVFPGRFATKIKPPQVPIYDHDDMVPRCPGCTWELEELECCYNCGWEADDDDYLDDGSLHYISSEEDGPYPAVPNQYDDFEPPDAELQQDLDGTSGAYQNPHTISSDGGEEADSEEHDEADDDQEDDDEDDDDEDDSDLDGFVVDDDEEEDGSASEQSSDAAPRQPIGTYGSAPLQLTFVDEEDEDEDEDEDESARDNSSEEEPHRTNITNRSGYLQSTFTSDEEDSESTPDARPTMRPGAIRRRVSSSEDVSNSDSASASENLLEDVASTSAGGSARSPISVKSDSEDDGVNDDHDDDEGPIPATRRLFRSG